MHVFRAWLHLNPLSGALLDFHCLHVLIFMLSAMTHASLYHSGFPGKDLIVHLGIWFPMTFFIVLFNSVQELSGSFVLKCSSSLFHQVHPLGHPSLPIDITTLCEEIPVPSLARQLVW